MRSPNTPNSTDSSSDRATTISFDRPSLWTPDTPVGPALALPALYSALKLSGSLFVEFLRVGDGDGKNHVVFSAPLKPTSELEGWALEIKNLSYFAVRISMELPEVPFLVLDDSEDGAFYNEDKEAGIDYYPGEFTVKFLPYNAASLSSCRTLRFDFPKTVTNLTLGALIDVAKDASLHKFVFLPYPGAEVTLWKGCRDFILQYWLLLVKKGIIFELTTDVNNPEHLTDCIAFFYKEGGVKDRRQVVDKGDFIRFNRDDEDPRVRAAYAK
ncbi:hypothetical protein BGW80DRAFT_523354 [Lactifluus volemus]|nr:hypothetical protein BGW80DRAFT_523354 [Lactifluus volemus]